MAKSPSRVTHFGVGISGGEVPLEMVPNVCGPDPALFAAPPPTLWDAIQPVPGHKLGDSVAAGGLAFIGQDLVHPGHAHHAVAGCMVLTDAPEQTAVVDLTRAHGPIGPAVEPAGRHPQAPTHQLNRVDAAAALNRLILHFDSLAKNVAASRKKSLSRFTFANSRFRARIS